MLTTILAVPRVYFRQRWQRWTDKRQPFRSSVELTQREIFIFLSAMGWLFLGLTLLIAIAAFNFQNNTGLFLAFTLASLGFLSQYVSFRNCSSLLLAADDAPAVFANQTAQFPLRLASATQRSHEAIGIGVNGNVQQWWDVQTATTTYATVEVVTHKRGWLPLPRLYLCSYFPFGWWRCWSYPALHARVLVYPRPIAFELGAGNAGSGASNSSSAQPGSEDFSEHQRYQQGDPPRQIDWKAYARERGLLTKKFIALQGSELILRLSDLPSADRELQLSWLCYVVLEAEKTGQRYGLELSDFVSAVANGDAHCQQCLRALALHENA